MKCTGCKQMGHKCILCYQNPASEYRKKTKAALVHQIQTHSSMTPVNTDTRYNSRIGTPVQRYPCKVSRSLDHPEHPCPLLLDDDVKNAIQKKRPQTPSSSIVITDVLTVDVSLVGPIIETQPYRKTTHALLTYPVLQTL